MSSIQLWKCDIQSHRMNISSVLLLASGANEVPCWLYQLVTAIWDEGQSDILWVTLIRLGLHSLLCYLQIVVLENSMQFHTYMFSFQFIHIPSCWPSSYSVFTWWGVSDSVACYAADYMFRTCQLMTSTLTSWNLTSDASSCCQCYGTQGTCQCTVKLTQQLGMKLRTDAIVRLLQPLLWTIILCTRQCTLVEKAEFATIVKHMSYICWELIQSVSLMGPIVHFNVFEYI